MLASRNDDREVESWREGVDTRLIASAVNGARQLTVFEQDCAPGAGAPLHWHVVEEVLQVVSGTAEIRVGDDRGQYAGGDVVIIPAGAPHGFTNTGTEPLRVLAILASPIFEAHYIDPPRDSRRWRGAPDT